MCDVYGKKSLTKRQCQNWFARFRSGDFYLKDAPRSGHPTEVDDDKIKAMIENNRRNPSRNNRLESIENDRMRVPIVFKCVS